MPEINTTLGLYKGGDKYAGQDTICETLKEINDENEKLFNGGTQQGKGFTKTYCDKKEESHTFAALFLKDEGLIHVTYSDLAGRPIWFKDGKTPGQSAADRTKKNPETGKYDNTKLCDESTFQYNGDPNMLGGHTEARLLTDLAGLGENPTSKLLGKKMVFNILWKNKNGEPPNAPCIDCFNMMCKAVDECGAEIEVCGSDGKPYPINKNESEKERDVDEDYKDYLKKLTGNTNPERTMNRNK